MPLQHQLRMPRLRIPKLHPPILTPTHDPTPIWRERHTQHEILMPLKHPNALATPRPLLRLTRRKPIPRTQLPHPDRLVQRPGNKMRPVRSKSNTVHTILMALLAFGALDQHAGLRVPDADAFVEGAGGDVATVWGDCDRRDAVFDLEREHALVLLDVPEADGAVTGAGGDVAAVGGEVEGVDVLVVTGEAVADGFGGDVPDLIVCVSCVYLTIVCDELTLMILSSAPVAKYLPSGLKHTLRMYKSPSCVVA
jgi:hypothetical protein